MLFFCFFFLLLFHSSFFKLYCGIDVDEIIGYQRPMTFIPNIAFDNVFDE